MGVAGVGGCGAVGFPFVSQLHFDSLKLELNIC